jgi:prolyl-tRNA synthetase
MKGKCRFRECKIEVSVYMVIYPQFVLILICRYSVFLTDFLHSIQSACLYVHALFILQTHEEAITELMASIPQLSYRQLPLRLYQVTSKFRDEIRPRFGLLRGKEFVMKDLYTFDVSADAATETYKTVSKAYENIFRRIGIQYVRGKAV